MKEVSMNMGHKSPIIAWDFDGTLCYKAKFPKIGEPRKYAKEVVNFLHSVGVKSIIWTCRSSTEDSLIQDDITPMKIWLYENGFEYTDVNTCYVPAGFNYESRKIFAHMYVDDRAFGWYENTIVMISVLHSYLVNIIGTSTLIADEITNDILHGKEVNRNGRRAVEHIINKWNT